VSTNTNAGHSSCIHHAVDRQAARNPQAVAIESRAGTVTYGELNARARAVAFHLLDVGVQPGDIVALSMRRSIDLIVSMLAVLKTGAAYLPLDGSHPAARRRKYLQDAAVRHLISDSDPAELSDSGCQIIAVKAMARPSRSACSEAALQYPSAPDDRAYVMFTSGSTGEAKGVVVPHRAVTRLVVNTNYIQISPADKILQLSPLSFDASTFEIWGALLNGATLVLSSSDCVDPNAIRSDVATSGVTIMWLTAALFHLIVDTCAAAMRPVHTLLAGGDVLNPRVVNRLFDMIPGITLINGYGPTENTTFTCCHRMTCSNRPPRDGVPIGRPISGTEVFILDESLAPVPAGSIGELFAAGQGLALGYLNGDRAGSFFRDERICTGLIYRTGDLVRENINRELEFVGRKDNLVKVRGFRVSLEEIKLSILQIPDVVEAAVVLRNEGVADQLLIAYVKTRRGSVLDGAQIRRDLAVFLPAYMIPGRITLRETLPITQNGKLDQSALRALET
jgi:amino acid adenylation domain-containing protein